MKKIETKHFTIWIWPDQYRGYFEHYLEGEDNSGELHFTNGTLTDYDGVFALCDEIVHALQDAGFKVPKSCCDNEEEGDECE
jgi:hypothetical protein